MNNDAVIASARTCFSSARAFDKLFPNAEHAIVPAKRDIDPEGWRSVHEWISRAGLHDRYVIWFVVAIEITADGAVAEIERPQLYLVEVVGAGNDQGRTSWELGIAQFEEGAWEELIESNGDFSAVGIDLRTDAPVDRFYAYWSHTRPGRHKVNPDGIALRAPFRFMM